MNDRTVTLLGGLLAAQLLLAAAIGLRGEEFGSAQPGKPLLALEQGQVDRLVIEQKDQKPLVLAKEGQGWRLPDLHGFPADARRVEALTGKLAGLKPRLAVATSADAVGRFKVSADAYERRLTIEGGGKALATLYLGGSAGARRSFARADGDNAVYEVELGTWEANVRPADWTDRDYLHLDPAHLARVELPGITLERKDGAWRLSDLAPGEQMVADQAEATARKLTSLAFLEVLGNEARPDYQQEQPELTATVRLDSGESHTLVFSKPQEGSDYVLKDSARPYYLKVAAPVVEGLKGSERKQLVRVEAPAGEAVVAQPQGGM